MAMNLLFSIFLVIIEVLFNITNGQNQPNFIFILADDQDLMFDSMSIMTNTQKHIIQKGITFNNAFIATPICCPSRTETITGRVFQNIKQENHNNCMHIAAKYNVFNNSQSMFQIFHRNGYNTASFGKLTNDMSGFWCNSNPSLNGFTRINCPCDFNNFYGLKYFDYDSQTNNQSLYNIPLNQEAYETSYVGNASLKWISEQIIAQDTNTNAAPFIAWIGPHAPHCPATPAAWYTDLFKDEIAPRTATYNVHVDEHNSFISTNPTMDNDTINWVDVLWRDRLRSLVSIDDLVLDIITLLEKYPTINNKTYVLYSSDHGYHLGQLRIPCCKKLPYETDIRIPMYLRGPNIESGSVSDHIVGNIDILPSFLSLAGIQYNADMYDGRTWTDFLMKKEEIAASNWREMYLVQYEATGTYNCGQDCSAWYPSKDGSVVPGQPTATKGYNDDFEAWMVDVYNENNWRALRKLNDVDNWIYIEFIHNDWVNSSFEMPIFYEFYNINADPYQVDNIYNELNSSIKAELHSTLMQYGACHGTECWY